MKGIKGLNGIRNIFIVCLILMITLTGVLAFSTKNLGSLNEAGLAVSKASSVNQTLRNGNGKPVELVNVDMEDTLYATVAGLIVGKNRVAIDDSFPLYVNGGASLRFFNEENWLLSADSEILPTYEGLYLSDGYTYGWDMQQADPDEFLFLILNNGLYMNAQNAVFTNRLGSVDIPCSSILMLSEDNIRWYSMEAGKLVYGEEEAVFDATMTIGSHTYRYQELLETLGLFREMTNAGMKGALGKKLVKTPVLPQEISSGIRLDGEHGFSAMGLQGQANSLGANDLNIPLVGATGTDGVNTPADDASNSRNGGDAMENDNPGDNDGDITGEGSDDINNGGNSGGGGPNGDDPGKPVVDPVPNPVPVVPEETNEPGQDETVEYTVSPPEPTESATEDTTSPRESEETRAPDYTVPPRETTDSPEETQHDSTEETTGGTGGHRKPVEETVNPESTEESSSSQDKPGTGGGDEPPSENPEDEIPKMPTVEFDENSFMSSSYAVYGKVKLKDPDRLITKRVRIGIYRDVKGKTTEHQVPQSAVSLSADDYYGSSIVSRKSFSFSEYQTEFILNPLPPETDFWIQISYTYLSPKRDKDGNLIKKESGAYEYEKLTAYSNLHKVSTNELNDKTVPPIKASWKEVFATASNGFRLDALKLENSAINRIESGGFISEFDGNYRSDKAVIYNPDDNSFENAKLDTLSYVTKLVYTLKDENENIVEFTVPSATMRKAKTNAEGTTYEAKGDLLPSNKRYEYSVHAYDYYGNKISLYTCVTPANAETSTDWTKSGETVGELYTQKLMPIAKIAEVENVTNSLTLKVSITDTDNALIGNELRLNAYHYGTDPQDDVQLSATDDEGNSYKKDEKTGLLLLTKDQNTAWDGLEYTIKINNLDFKKPYGFKLIGDYCLQPEFDGAPGKIAAEENAVLYTVKRIYTADIPKGIIEFKLTTEEIKDSCGTFILNMSKVDGISVLDYVNSYTISVLGTDVSYELTANELGEEYTYSPEGDNVVVTLKEPNTDIQFIGKKEAFENKTLWEAIKCDENGQKSPVSIKVKIPTDSLSSNTTYTVAVKSAVKKEGSNDKEITTRVAPNTFTTTKIQPIIKYSDFIVTNSSVYLTGFSIEDCDETIKDGKVVIQLWHGDNLIQTKNVIANQDKETVQFDGIIPNTKYVLKFYAQSYNDTNVMGAEHAKTLDEWIFVGGSSLGGTLSGLQIEKVVNSSDYKINCSALVTGSNEYIKDAAPKVLLYRADSIKQPDVYKKEAEYDFDSKNKAEKWEYQVEDVILPENKGWRMDLVVSVHGEEIVLDTISFQTNSVSLTFSSQDELEELLIPENANKNLICIGDFDWSKKINNGITFNGTIDFQGHTITATNGIPLNGLVGNVGPSGVIKNLVINIAPNEQNSPIVRAIFPYNYGTIENLIVKIGMNNAAAEGNVYVKSNTGLIMGSCGGFLRNFAIYLHGDLHLLADVSTTEKRVGLVASMVYGSSTISNGLIQSTNGSSVYFDSARVGYNGGIWAGYQLKGTISNVFTSFNTYFPVTSPNGDGSKFSTLALGQKGIFQNAYHEGEYYYKNSAGVNAIQEAEFATSAGSGKAENVWHVSRGSYSLPSPENNYITVLAANHEKIYDAEWQQGITGGGFDAASNVELGYYPRVKMPKEMQISLEYIKLPTWDLPDAPIIVSDTWAKGDTANRGNESGTITLRFLASDDIVIRSVCIDGLFSSNESSDIESIGSRRSGDYLDVDFWVRGPKDNEAGGYKSAYVVKSITYTGYDKKTRRQETNYTTTEIEFWKEVNSVDGWASIKNHLDWNYRLTDDLKFNEESIDRTMISQGSFTGKLDGDGHKISQMKLENAVKPSVIYRLGSGAVIKNLLFDNVTISAGTTTDSTPRTAIIGIADKRSTIQNVHVRNSSITGVGQIGAIVGYSQAVVIDCSVADTKIAAGKTSKTVYLGGLVGNSDVGISNCYARNITINAGRSVSNDGIGGIVGYLTGDIKDCYATGTIEAESGNIGGIYGDELWASCADVWADVSIKAGANAMVGGIGGDAVSNPGRILAVGNIDSSSSKANRAFGDWENTSSTYKQLSAYVGQIVGTRNQDDMGDCQALISAEAMCEKSTWVDVIGMSANYDYSCMKTDGKHYYPKLKSQTGATKLWNALQDLIPMPDPNPPKLTCVSAEYNKTVGGSERYYEITLDWYHPGVDDQTAWNALTTGGGSLTIPDAGIDITSIDDVDHTTVNIPESTTRFMVKTDALVKAMDTYKAFLECKVNDTDYKLDCTFAFETVPYWEIDCYATWQDVMGEHGTGKENFRITGEVDFDERKENDTVYNNLVIGRLEGETGGKIVNLKYDGSTGDPWIESVGIIDSISFENISGDFTGVHGNREATAVIMAANTVRNTNFEGITVVCNSKTCSNVGFFGSVYDMTDTTASKLALTKNDTTTTGTNAGALAAYINGHYENLTVEGSTVNMPGTSSVGGVFGSMTDSQKQNKSGEFMNLDVTGQSAGGVCYSAGVITKASVDGVKVSATGSAAGFAVSILSMDDVRVKGSEDYNTITSKAKAATNYVGGVGGNTRSYDRLQTNIRAEGLIITGNANVGGLFGRLTARISKAQAVNIQINYDTTASGINANMAGGAIGRVDYSDKVYTIGFLTVRDVHVNAKTNAGGAVGYSGTATLEMDRVYVAEDVTVYGEESSGGVVGSVAKPKLSNFACGAEVSGLNNVGGIVGLHTSGEGSSLEGGYFKGTVKAYGDYAGGLIGRSNSGMIKLQKLVVASNVISNGNNATAWANVKGDTDHSVAIWEESTVNGRTVTALLQGSNTNGYIVQDEKNLWKAEDFTSIQKWESVLSKSIFGYKSTDRTKYMPFILNAGKELPDTFKYNNKDVGIKVPKATEASDYPIVAYMSGPGTVNIESPAIAGKSVSINGKTYTADANGVITLGYQIGNGLNVESKDLSSGLARKVMTFGSYWYYIDNGNLYYGKKLDIVNVLVDLGGKTPVHLQNGCVQCADGFYYQLVESNGGVTLGEGTKINAGEQYVAKPFYTVTIKGDQTGYNSDTYYYFTQVGGNNGYKSNLRYYYPNGTRNAFSPEENMVYDSLMFCQTSKGVYRAYLTKEGSLVKTPTLKTNTLNMDGITQTSNSLNYNDTIAVIKYENGRIVILNYENGTYVDNGVKESDGILQYAASAMSEIIKSLFPRENHIDDSFLLAFEEFGDSMQVTIVDEISEIGGLTPMKPPIHEPDQETGGNGGGAEGRGGAENGESHPRPDEDEREPVYGDDCERPDDNSGEYAPNYETIPAETQDTAPVGLGTVSAVAPDGTAESEIGNGTERDEAETEELTREEQAVQAGETCYIPGEGVYVAGEFTVSESNLMYVPGEGIYVNGKLAYVAVNPGAGIVGGAVELMTAEDWQAYLTQILSDGALVYDAQTGTYNKVSGEKLLADAENEDDEPAGEGEKDSIEKGADSFKVGQGFSRTLTNDEKGGFAILCVLGIGGVLILAYVYFKVVRKKKAK